MCGNGLFTIGFSLLQCVICLIVYFAKGIFTLGLQWCVVCFVLCRLSPGRYTDGITLQWSSKFHYIHGPLSFFCLFLFQLGNKKKENKKRKKKSDSCNHLCSVFLQLQQGKTTRQMFFLFGTCIILNANMLYNFEPGPYKNPPLTVSRLHLLK